MVVEHHFTEHPVYYKIFDIVIHQLGIRFEGMNFFVNKFRFLCPQVMITLLKELFKSVEKLLQQIYFSFSFGDSRLVCVYFAEFLIAENTI